MEKRVSIVCCYNKLEILEKYLINSLKKQNEIYDLIVIDNRNGTYISSAQAYNSILDKIKTKYVCFVHQDIEFLSQDTLFELIEWAEECQGIIGVAGASSKGRFSCVLEGEDNHVGCGESGISQFQNVQSLDECLLMMETNIAKKIKFDEAICAGWHLYGVEICLAAKEKGYDIFVVPVLIHHASGGNIDISFYRILKMVTKKYRKSVPSIYTTCIKLKHTNGLYCNLYCLFHWLTRKVYKSILRRE